MHHKFDKNSIAVLLQSDSTQYIYILELLIFLYYFF